MLFVVLLVLQVLILPTLSMTSDQYAQMEAMSSAPQFNLAGQTFLSKVEYIYDGDSVKIIVLICDDFKRFDTRTTGIDTPEVRSGVVREFGKEVRDILRGMIGGKIVKIRAGQFDKYGRMLVEIWGMTTKNEKIKINDYLVEHLMAKKYDGGTKQAFTQADADEFHAQYTNAVWPEFKNYPYGSE